MPNDEFNAFDDRSVKKIASAVSRLKAQQENLHRDLLALRARAESQYSQVRTGITSATDEFPTYPTDGCQLPFRVYDLDFPQTTGCPATDKRPWSTERIGRSADGEYIEEGTEVIFVEIPNPEGNRFWLIPVGTNVGTVFFSLLEDRSRETDAVSGKFFGQADAIVEAIVGDVPVEVGDTINVRFGGQRWLGAVGPRSGAPAGTKGCEGIADYYRDQIDVWIVKECQELEAEFWFRTKDRRTIPGAPEEKIEISALTEHMGRMNGDYYATNWKAIGGNDPLKVTFLQDTFPYAFETALGRATLDVDISNTTSNNSMRYVVAECNQGAILNEALHASFCPFEEPQVSSQEPGTWFPFGQRWPQELFLSALDRMALSSKDGGIGWTTYSDTIKKHIILNTEHKPYKFLMPPGQNCSPMQLEIQALTCKSPVPAEGFYLDYALTEFALTYEETQNSGSGSGQACADPKLVATYKRAPFFRCGTESGAIRSEVALEQLLVTTDVYDDDDCLVHQQTHVIVFGSCDVIEENIVCTTDEQCESG